MRLEADVAHPDPHRAGGHETVRRHDAPFRDERRQRARIVRARASRRRDRGHGQRGRQNEQTDPEHTRSISDRWAGYSWLLVEDSGRFDTCSASSPTLGEAARAMRREPCGMAEQPAPSAGVSGRPRVLVLGGGFGGLGAARKLEKADVDVVARRRERLPQLPADALPAGDRAARHDGGRALAARPLPATRRTRRSTRQPSPPSISTRARCSSPTWPRCSYDYLVVGARRSRAVLRLQGRAGARVPALHDGRRVAAAGRTSSERWEAADRDPSLVEDGALNIVVVGGGPTGIESVGALSELYRSDFAKDYRGARVRRGAVDPRRGRPDALPDVQARHPRVRAARAREAGRRDHARRARRVRRADARDARVRQGAAGAHARLGRRVCRRTRSPESLGLELERGNRIAVDPELRLPDHPEVFAVGDAAWITDATTGDVLPSSAPWRCRPESTPARTSRGSSTASEPKPFEYTDKGTMAAIARGAAVAQLHGGRTMKGKTAFLAWGAVHLDAALRVGGPHEGDGRLDLGRLHATSARGGSSAEARRRRDGRGNGADVLVVFGITGDLAKVMTFRSLYRLEQRGLLDCPIVGVAVDDWTVDQLVERARDVDRRHRRAARRGGVRPASPRGSRTCRATSATPPPTSASARDQGRRAAGLLPRDPAVPVRHGRQGPRRGRADEDRARRRREAVRPRPGVGARRSPTSCTSTSTSRSSSGSTTTSGRWASRRSSTCGSRTRCSSRSGTGTTSTCVQITMAEDFGVEDRGHFYDPVGALRDVVVNHLMQVVAAAAMEPPVARRPRRRSRTRRSRCSARSWTADPAHYVRGQYDGLPLDRRRRRRTRRPRRTPRCGSTSRTGAGPACRSSSAPASGCR